MLPLNWYWKQSRMLISSSLPVVVVDVTLLSDKSLGLLYIDEQLLHLVVLTLTCLGAYPNMTLSVKIQTRALPREDEELLIARICRDDCSD